MVPFECGIHGDDGNGGMTFAYGFAGPWNMVSWREWTMLPPPTDPLKPSSDTIRRAIFRNGMRELPQAVDAVDPVSRDTTD